MGKQNSKHLGSIVKPINDQNVIKKQINEVKEDIYKQYVTYLQSASKNYPLMNKLNCQYLIQQGISLQSNSIVLYIQQNLSKDEKTINELLNKIQDKTCNIVIINTSYNKELVQNIMNCLKFNSSLIKINIELNSFVFQPNTEMLEQFTSMIKIYEQLDNIRQIYYISSIYILRIDVDSRLFQIEIQQYNNNQLQDDFSNFKLLPTVSKYKFSKLQIHINIAYLMNNLDILLQFIKLNKEELTKVSLQIKDVQEYYKQILDVLTDINISYGLLKEINLNSHQKTINSEFYLDDYFIQNKNLEYFIIHFTGIHQNTFQIDLDNIANRNKHQLIVKIINNIEKITNIQFNGGVQHFGNFMEQFEQIPERRIKLTIEMQHIEQEIYYKLLKQLTNNPYFEIELLFHSIHIGSNFNFEAKKLTSYQNEIKLYMIIYMILKKQLQNYLIHRAENSFIDLYIE